MKFMPRFPYWIRRRCLTAGLIITAVSAPLSAQEGHPFDGTWRGTIENETGERPVVLIMDYDGENIGGMINPGRNTIRIQSAELDAPNWLLTVRAETSVGEAIEFSGTLHEIGARNRYMTGTWTQGGEAFAFRVTRE